MAADPMDAHQRRSIDDLPIPAEIEVGQHWSEFMIELASIIGAYDALRLVDRIGGHNFNVPGQFPERWIVSDIIGPRKARLFHDNYAGWNNTHSRRISVKIAIPTAQKELRAAKLGPVIAALRANTISLRDACELTGMSTKHLSTLRNRPDVKTSGAAYVPPARLIDTRQITIFDHLGEAA